jgi:hypothetical protein
MTPPPITARVPGTFSKSSAPVELTMYFSSMVMPGRLITSLPVAMIIFLAVIDSVELSFDILIVFLSSNDPQPIF